MRAARALIVASFVLAPAALPAAGEDSRGGPADSAIAEYCRRAREISPLDADAHHRLGLWCRERGLEEFATRALEQALAADPDHAGSREALGYVRRGSGWIRKGETPRSAGVSIQWPPASTGGTPDPASAGGSGAPPSGGDAPSTATPVVEVKQVPGMAPPPSSLQPEVGSVPDIATAPAAGAEPGALLRKRQWAEAAAKAFKTAFVDLEDSDFLIHTTYPSSRQPQVRALQANLRRIKSDAIALLGLRAGSGQFWPERLQLVLLKSREEHQRFAEMIDKVRIPVDSDGAYTAGEHTVLWKPDSIVLPRLVGETILDRAGGSDRWVAWWLKKGVAEALAASSPEGKERDLYRRHFQSAAKLLEAQDSAVSIYSLIETRDYPRRDEDRSRALALTLFDYLIKRSSRGLRSLVRELKSDKAPAPPSGDDAAQWNEFHLSYLVFQQESIESSFGTRLDKLEAGWKIYVQRNAESLGGPSTPAAGQGQPPPRRRGG